MSRLAVVKSVGIQKLAAWLGGAVLLLALGVAVALWTFSQIEEAANVRQHTYEVINRTEDLMASIRDAETGQRGYLLTGDEAFLESYLAATVSIPDALKDLRRLTLVTAAQGHLFARGAAAG